MGEGELSLAAETTLLSVDPEGGPLLADRSSLRDAIMAAREIEGWQGSPRRQLLRAGLVKRKGLLRPRLKLTDPVATTGRFNAIKDAGMRGRFATDRDRQLFVLLAQAGVLARRLNEAEQRMAEQRLAELKSEPGAPAGP